eukprot:gene12918-3780_t
MFPDLDSPDGQSSVQPNEKTVDLLMLNHYGRLAWSEGRENIYPAAMTKAMEAISVMKKNVHVKNWREPLQ